jgi:hypothetical protein
VGERRTEAVDRAVGKVEGVQGASQESVEVVLGSGSATKASGDE